jgi:hypothetical protein
MDERLKFIARLLDGEKMAAMWWEFGISNQAMMNAGFEGRARGGVIRNFDRANARIRPKCDAHQSQRSSGKTVFRFEARWRGWPDAWLVSRALALCAQRRSPAPPSA